MAQKATGLMNATARLLLVLLATSLTSTGCVSPSRLGQDDYDVYDTVLQYQYSVRSSERERRTPPRFVLANYTDGGLDENTSTVPPRPERLGQGVPPSLSSAIREFVRERPRELPLEPRFHPSLACTLVTRAPVESLLMAPDGPTRFQELYRANPRRGYFTLSRVGFSDDRKCAFVYIENHCGFNCVSGSFFIIVRDGDSWRVFGPAGRWIA
jgi:hypothetical protein